MNGMEPMKFRSSVTGLVTLVDPYQSCIAPLKPERTAAPSKPSGTCHAALRWESWIRSQAESQPYWVYCTISHKEHMHLI